MSTNQATAKLVFAGDDSERALQEARSRGYLSHILVEIGNCCYPVIFYDPVRLQQDLEESGKHGRPFVADPGMIVLTEITPAAMEAAVQRLCDEGYFEYLTPVNPQRLAQANPLAWPP
jgi:hypothetical protein